MYHMSHDHSDHVENTMRKPREAVSVRVDAEDYKYLKLLAYNNGCQSIAETISTVIKQCEQASPMGFCIWKVIRNDGSETYDVNLPDGYPVGFGDSVAGALEQLTYFRNKYGCTDERRFKLEKEIAVLDLRFDDTGNGIMGLV
jgi:hypothetical protein